ncbi:MAG: sensor histidine kinase [Frankia sp.]|nr:sensor histidine kinase [Frankia sp.]
MADSVTEQAPTLVPLLLALAATVPVAFLLSHTLTVLTTCVAATALALLTADRPPVASMVAVACAAGVVAVRLLRRARSEAGHRAAARTSVSESLVEFAARGERVRIARELHDVVAHHLSMISVQADAARLTTPGMPDLGARRLAAIGDTARAALTEMRRLVGVLREDAPESESRLPQPGLAELTALVDEARAATGSSMRLIVSGPVAALDPGVQLTTYRIVQEALTNARRHAPGAAVDVVLHYDVDTLRVRVRDNGPAGAGPATPGRTGHGLVGMRERVAMLGGTLHAGPAPGCGFLVEADLPAVTP